MKSKIWIIPQVVRSDYTVEFPWGVTEQEAIELFRDMHPLDERIKNTNLVERFVPDWARRT